MARYAENTSVASNRSRAEIERILARYGASKFMYGWGEEEAVIGFVAHHRAIRFKVPLPDRNDSAFTRTPTGRRSRSSAQAEAAYEQSVRQRWRALALVVKAKLEAVEAGIAEFEDEFLAYIVIPQTGETIGAHIRPQLDETYGNLKGPPQLALPPTGGTSGDD